MKRLLIIVPKGSAIDFYLADVGFIYDKIVRTSDRSYYKINLTDKMSLINLLISKFGIQDFSVRCYYGVFTFRVRS